MANNGPKVLKSKVFTTVPFRAVFPDLNKPDRFDSYKVDVDCETEAGGEIEDTIKDQIAELLPKALADFGLEEGAWPQNSVVRTGEAKDGTPFRRIGFKMKSTKKVKGKDVPVRPRLVDAHRNPMTEVVFGGSLIKVGYYIQATLVNGTFYCSVKLAAVQVLEHVGPGGETAIEDIFGEEDGFTTQADEDAAPSVDPVPDPDAPAAEDVVVQATNF
jgi:hypothetical protein